MKNPKFLLLALLMAVVLISGQPHAIAFASPSNTGMVSDGLFDDDFQIGVTSVSYLLDGAILTATKDSNGYYGIVSTDEFALARITVDFGGFTRMMDPGDNATSTHDDELLGYMGGALFLINNGEIIEMRGAINNALGVDIYLDSKFNTLTFMYLGYDYYSGMVVVSDTVNIIVAESQEDLDNFSYKKVLVPVDLTATDSFEEGDFNATGIMSYGYPTGYKRNVIFEPTEDLTLSLTDSEGATFTASSNNQVFDADLLTTSPPSMTISGTYDSTGFNGPQLKGFNFTSFEYDGILGDAIHDAAKGYAFFFDADGMRSLSSVNGTNALLLTGPSNVQSQISVAVFAHMGYWTDDQDVYGTVGADWDGLFSDSFFYGTHDFSHVDFGVTVLGLNDDVLIVTETVEGPGFGAVLAFTTIGLIAYVAPRLRKD